MRALEAHLGWMIYAQMSICGSSSGVAGENDALSD